MIGEFHPQPKPQPRIVDRIDYKAQRAKQERVFLAAVWKRDGSQCRGCGRRLRRGTVSLEQRGEVHHRHGRRVRPEDRYVVAAAVLLCRTCHLRPDVIARFRT